MTDIEKKREMLLQALYEANDYDMTDYWPYQIKPCDIKITKAELRRQRKELRKCATDSLN